MAYRRAAGASRKSHQDRAAEAQAMADRYAAFRESLDDDEIAAYAERFGHYSERNALLIVMQDPDATVVHGFHDWKKHGRKVKGDGSAKGKGIQIIAYAGASDNMAVAVDDPTSKRRTYFRKAYVFDIRHTEPLSQTKTANLDAVAA